MPFNSTTYHVNKHRKGRVAEMAKARAARSEAPPEDWQAASVERWREVQANRVRWAVRSARMHQRLFLMYRRFKRERLRT